MTILISFFFFNFSKKKTGFYKLSFRFFYFNSIPRISTHIPRIPTLILRIPTHIPLISTLILRIPPHNLHSSRSHPGSPHFYPIPRIPTMIPCILTHIPHILTPIPSFPSFRSPISHSGFYR